MIWEELEAAHNIGRLGAGLIDDGDTVLTHCNAGSLATAIWECVGGDSVCCRGREGTCP